MRAAGIHRVHTPQELIDVSSALLRCPPLRGRRVAVLSDGGGHGSIAAAECERRGLALPELGPALQSSLAGALPPAAGVSNPIDLAGGAEQDVSTFSRVAAELLSSSELDALYVTGYFGGYEEYGRGRPRRGGGDRRADRRGRRRDRPSGGRAHALPQRLGRGRAARPRRTGL